jgi:hypothetical protein
VPAGAVNLGASSDVVERRTQSVRDTIIIKFSFITG